MNELSWRVAYPSGITGIDDPMELYYCYNPGLTDFLRENGVKLPDDVVVAPGWAIIIAKLGQWGSPARNETVSAALKRAITGGAEEQKALFTLLRMSDRRAGAYQEILRRYASGELWTSKTDD